MRELLAGMLLVGMALSVVNCGDDSPGSDPAGLGEGEGEGEGEGQPAEGEGEGEGEGDPAEGEGEGEGEGQPAEGEGEGEGEGTAEPNPEPGALPRFALPVHEQDRAKLDPRHIFGVDHDPVTHEGTEQALCSNYAGQNFPFCYDGHDGTDFLLSGGFNAMDRGSARIVAAAGGEVVQTEDGHYDRCHAAFSGDIDCDGHEMAANFVRLRHADGWQTSYFHMRSGSVQVAVGDRVRCGELLGVIGSSGISSAPHLHFEVQAPDGAVWDPYAGPLSQPESLWTLQDGADGLPGQTCDAAWGHP